MDRNRLLGPPGGGMDFIVTNFSGHLVSEWIVTDCSGHLMAEWIYRNKLLGPSGVGMDRNRLLGPPGGGMDFIVTNFSGHLVSELISS